MAARKAAGAPVAALATAVLLLAAAAAGATGPVLKTHTALTKPIPLRAGEVSNDFHKLPIPKGPIAVYSFAAELVKEDEDGNVVPALLSEVYLHHHVVGTFGEEGAAGLGQPLPALQSPMKPADISRGIGFGAGTEARGTPQNFSHPFAFVTDEGEDHWLANVHIINIGPLTEEQAHRCLECPCTSEDEIDVAAGTLNGHKFHHTCNGQLLAEGNARCSLETYTGGLSCCDQGEFCLEEAELPASAPTTYYLRYSVQYTTLVPADVRPLYLAGCCDATGDMDHAGAVEYDIPACDEAVNPGCVHSLATRQPLGGDSDIYGGRGAGSDDREVDIVFAVGHQHRGGMGMQLFDERTGASICESRPTYGTHQGVVGDEDGYIVAMSPCRFDPPLRRRLSDVVRVVSLYNSTVAHTGVMGLMYIAIADAADSASVLELPAASGGAATAEAHAQQAGLLAVAERLQVLVTDRHPRPAHHHGSSTMMLCMHPMVLPAAALLAGMLSMYGYMKLKERRQQQRAGAPYTALHDQVIFSGP